MACARLGRKVTVLQLLCWGDINCHSRQETANGYDDTVDVNSQVLEQAAVGINKQLWTAEKISSYPATVAENFSRDTAAAFAEKLSRDSMILQPRQWAQGRVSTDRAHDSVRGVRSVTRLRWHGQRQCQYGQSDSDCRQA